jgi:hypothetical protein
MEFPLQMLQYTCSKLPPIAPISIWLELPHQNPTLLSGQLLLLRLSLLTARRVHRSLEFVLFLKEHSERDYGSVNQHSSSDRHQCCCPSDDF